MQAFQGNELHRTEIFQNTCDLWLFFLVEETDGSVLNELKRNQFFEW